MAAVIVAAVTAAASWDLFVEQGRGVGGAHQFDPAECIDWGQSARAGGAMGLGIGEAGFTLLMSPFYGMRVLRNVLDGQPIESPRQFNRQILELIGLGDEYDQIVDNIYFNLGNLVGNGIVIGVSLPAFTQIFQALQGGGRVLMAASNGQTFTATLVGISEGQMVLGVAGAVGAGQVILRIKGNNRGRDPYKMGKNDVDWRGQGKTIEDALAEAFRRTGVDPLQFDVTKWAKDVYGKSHPVEWRSPDGAEVNIDFPHTTDGPDVPHVGWQTAGKRSAAGGARGHILLDSVPYGR